MSHQQLRPLPPIQQQPQHHVGGAASQPQQSSNPASKAASKAGAYGGSEVGAAVGSMVGPPVIGGVVGNIIGERVGQDLIRETGLDRAARDLNRDLAGVVGQRRADKVGEIAMTAMGYSESERCVCCPCMPRSQLLYFVMASYLVFNWFRLVVGVTFDWSCDRNVTEVVTADFDPAENTVIFNKTQEAIHANETSLDDFWEIRTDPETNVTTYLVSYPCEFGFEYLVVGAAVWVVFLPFYVCTLLGNCWRQCCCCLCDPLVCTACAVDLLKRCLCECGRFSLVDFVWHSMIVFQIMWAVAGGAWLIKATVLDESLAHRDFDPTGELVDFVIASVCLDLILAGSELFHHLRMIYISRKEENETGTEMVERQPQ